METWDWLDDPPAVAAENMARDEALLRSAAARGRPLLRVYGWREPAVSIGYFMKYPAPLAAQYAIVRRPTGGGIVYHDHDTTYTVVVPPDHALHRLATAEAYGVLHRAVAAALDPKSEISNLKSPPTRGPYECFANPVAGDVMAGDRKLAGGAQRRTRQGMLHQGSIAGRVATAALVRAFQETFALRFVPYQPTATETALVAKLVRDKYATSAWTQRFV